MLGLKEAAELAGVAQSTIYRAVKNGRISASSGDADRLLFDPAEIGRWSSTRARHAGASEARTVPQPADSHALASDLARIEAELAAERRRSMDLERQCDRWHSMAVSAMQQLTDQRAAPARPSFWRRLFG
jgi:hypothetical protein